jgi:hypothetical protein
MSTTEDTKVSESHGIGTTWTIHARTDEPWQYDVWVSSGPASTKEAERLSWMEASARVAQEIQREIEENSTIPEPTKPDKGPSYDNYVEAIKAGYRGLREAVYELVTGRDTEGEYTEAVGRAQAYADVLSKLLPSRSVPSFYLASLKRLQKDGRIPATIPLDRMVQVISLAGGDIMALVAMAVGR